MDRYAWILEDMTPLKEKRNAKEKLGIWNYNEEKIKTSFLCPRNGVLIKYKMIVFVNLKDKLLNLNILRMLPIINMELSNILQALKLYKIE